jgi:uncharacterized protein YndB with AHSA1/START domain
MTQTKHQPNPALDLILERVIDVPRELVWRAWTDPEQIKQWITPAPWKTVDCKIDARPGGIFSLVMQSPEGVNMPETPGCVLEVVENEKLVWTSALGPGYRPLMLPETEGCDSLYFTAVITMESHGSGTKYTALVIHGDEASQKRHAEMGFHEGWGAALDQLVELVKK